jgi:head-tail adaptor
MSGLLTTTQTTQIIATITNSLDASLPLERNTPGVDMSGHATESWASHGSISCNVKNATASMLQLYAGIIGSQRAVVIRVMETTDARQGDRITYLGLKWLLHELNDAESYTWTKELLGVVIV